MYTRIHLQRKQCCYLALPLRTSAKQGSLSCNARSAYNGDIGLCPLGKTVADADADRELFLVALKENFFVLIVILSLVTLHIVECTTM